MNHQQIIDLAREAGLFFVPEANSPLVKIVMRAVEMEREDCILDIKMHTPRDGHDSPGWKRMNSLIDAINARGQQ